MPQRLARFFDKCPRCTFEIRVGDPIIWRKGSKARHVDCDDPRPGPPSTLTPFVGCACLGYR